VPFEKLYHTPPQNANVLHHFPAVQIMNLNGALFLKRNNAYFRLGDNGVKDIVKYWS